MTDHDGSFRRLIETVRDRQLLPGGRPGRPPKNRVPTTGHFAAPLHNRMKALAEERTARSQHRVSVADVYNEASQQLISDLHALLGDEFRLPAGAVTLSAVLGLRELIDRPIRTPLSSLSLQANEQQRTTLYFNKSIWEALVEISLRFSLYMRRPIHVHRLLELSAAWYLAGLEPPSDE